MRSIASVVLILRAPCSINNKETKLAEMIERKDGYLSDMLATNNKIINEECKQNERTGELVNN